MTEQTQLGLAVRTESLHVDGARIAVTVRRPADLAPDHALPAVVMGIGFAGVRGGYLRNFAETFARAGTTTFAFDYRGFGDSEGSPRQEVDPWAQISDYRDVLRFAKGYPGVDPESIVVWGSSLSGGHAIVLAATDPTVKCAIAQVPHVSGVAALQRTFTDQMRAVLMAALDHDRAQRLRGSTPGTIAVIDDGQGRPAAVYSTPEAIESYTFSRDHLARDWINEVTLRSIENVQHYEPADFLRRDTHSPLLMIVAEDDTITFTDLELLAFDQAPGPKELQLLPGGHFDPYRSGFDRATAAALEFMAKHVEIGAHHPADQITT